MADGTENTNSTKSSHKIPADKVNLKVILVSGKTNEFLFSPSDTAGGVTQHIFDNWPDDWTDEERQETNILRLIYQGRFLHGNVSLGALQLHTGKTTVMHLVARETLPEPNNHGNIKKDKGLRSSGGGGGEGGAGVSPRATSTGCCTGCLIS